ncbi:MAG: phosphoribosyl-AMP cyclohydrolase [Planctomycetes bacterium]|nr:phosphoribosyl-AMP cyclohydrolase [Planctomycetota bacterium]
MPKPVLESLLSHLKLSADGLVPSIIVDDESGRVLTLSYQNRESLALTIETGYVHVFRRSKGKVMKKGVTSGHTQLVVRTEIDCEGKSIVFRVKQHVAACHKGYYSCYHTEFDIQTGDARIATTKVFDGES